MSERPATDSVLLMARGLGKLYPEGQVRALSHVSLQINRGDYLAIMGPSGSGKSTLLNILGALDDPTEGQVFFEGKPLAEMPSLDQYRSQNIGFVFQAFHLLPVLTALENVQVPMFETSQTAAQRVARARHLLQSVNMDHRLYHLPNQLSVGERQRVAIARALANEPAVLLADEPTGNLDSEVAEEILQLFARLHEQNHLTVVIVTHDAEVARQTGRVIRMRDGRIVES